MRLSVQIEFDKILDLNTNKDSVVVGRAQDVVDLVIPHNSISRRHCKIEYIDKQFYITDLKSSNGVIVDGVKIPPMVRTKITPQSSVKIAKLDCELSDVAAEADASQIESHELNPDFTSTIRIARIDLEKDILETRQITKSPPRVKGPRNPITHIERTKEKKGKSFKSLLSLIIFVALIFLGFFLYRSFKTL